MWNGFPLYKQFSLDLTLWRYLEWFKFEDLVKTSSIFFTKVDYLIKNYDDAEGKLTMSEAEMLEFIVNTTFQNLKNQPTPIIHVSGIPFTGNPSIDINAYRQRIDKKLKHYLSNMYINCWHYNSSENKIMWEKFIPDGNGVAICTTARALLDALTDTSEDVFASMVEYINHAEEPISEALWRGGLYTVILEMLIRKKLSYSYEEEFRLISWTLSEQDRYDSFLQNIIQDEKMNVEKGRRLKINLSALKPTIVLHPKAEPDLRDRVVRLLASQTDTPDILNWAVDDSKIHSSLFE